MKSIGFFMNSLQPKEALNLIEANKKNPDFVILDIRTAQDFRTNRIEGAMNLPYHDAAFERKLKQLDRNKTYLVYCSSDSISNITVETMKELGFSNVQNIFGGIFRWYKQGLPLFLAWKNHA